MCKLLLSTISLLVVFVVAASGLCVMPREVPSDLRESVSQAMWNLYVRRQQLQIQANGGCQNSEPRKPCKVEVVVERDFPGVCQNAQGMPVCMESNPKNGSDPRSMIFHPDCMYLFTEEVLKQNLRTNPRPEALLAFVRSLVRGPPSGETQANACNITEMVTVTYAGECFPYTNGYTCRSTSTDDSVFDPKECKTSKP